MILKLLIIQDSCFELTLVENGFNLSIKIRHPCICLEESIVH